MNHQPNRICAIAFDLDGTLVDSVPDLAVAVQETLASLGFDKCTEQQVRGWVGNGAKKLMARALFWASGKEADSQQLQQVMPTFMDNYQRYLHQHSRLYAGVAETIAELHKQGYKMAVVTNKPYQFAVPLIEAFELQSYFELILGGDTLAKMKPDPMPLQYLIEHWGLSEAQMLMVGDSKNDIIAAKSAGIASIGLTYGYNYGEDIGLAEPNAVCQQFNQVLSWLATEPVTL